MQVTSKTGKQIDLAIDATRTEIVAKAGEISFGAEQTANGFRSRFAAALPGGRRAMINVEFEGAELAKVQALFAELHADIEQRAAADAERQRHHDAVRKMMAE